MSENRHCEVIRAPDGHGILIDYWRPANDRSSRAIIQIFHGLGEHTARYERFALQCIRHGIVVIAHSHRGHGENCAIDDLGHYADEDGWNKVLDDAGQVQAKALEDHPGLPLMLLGHSMGSYIAQAFVMRNPENVCALALSASTYASRLELRFGQLLSRIELSRHGPRYVSAILNKLGFGNFNKEFAPNRTEFDWLSRDEHEVDRYVADPLCGAPSSVALWRDLMGGLLSISSTSALQKIPAELPILITGGAQDPVGGERGLTRLARAYRRSGHLNVTLKIYPGGRHEMLNETNRDEFADDLIAWFGA